MDLPPLPSPPIRLMPLAPGAPSLGAVGISLAIHGGVIALAIAGAGRWVGSLMSSAPASQPVEVPVTLTGYTPVARPSLHEHSSSAVRPSRPALPAAPRFESGSLTPPPLNLAAAPTIAMSEMEPMRPEAPERHGELAVALRAHEEPIQHADHSVLRVAQLRGNPSEACPELRLPRSGSGRRDTLAVAVAFIVDTVGSIDPATIQIVQAPGRPHVETGFVPHIYTVSASARVDRSLPTEASAYGAIVAGDVLSHIASLRFHPGSRNGRPAQSMVLISCQVT
jgi:hypothetical protein